MPPPSYASSHPCISPSIHPSPSHLSFYHLLIHFSFHPFICHLFTFLPFVQSCNQPSFIRPPPTFPSIHLSIQTYPHLPIQKFIICLSFQSPPDYLFVHLSIHPCLHLSPFNPVVHSSFHSFIHHFIHHFICPSIHLPMYLLIYFPFIHPTIILLPLCIHSSTRPRIHPFFHPPPPYPSIHASVYPYVLSTHKSIQPSTPVHLPTRSHSPSFYPFFISCTLSLTTHVMILTYKHPSSFHTQIYPPIHLSIPPQYMVICAFIYLPIHSCTCLCIYQTMYPPRSLNIIYPVIHLPTVSTSPFTFTFRSIIHPSIDLSFTPLLFPLFIHPVTQSPHSFISLFPNYFPFHLPPLLPSLSTSIMLTESWHILGAMRASIRCRMFPVPESQTLRFGRKDIHLGRERCLCLAMWSGPCRWDTGYGSGGILRKLDDGTGGMPFLFVGGIVSSQCSDESGLCWRIRSGE